MEDNIKKVIFVILQLGVYIAIAYFYGIGLACLIVLAFVFDGLREKYWPEGKIELEAELTGQGKQYSKNKKNIMRQQSKRKLPQ